MSRGGRVLAGLLALVLPAGGALVWQEAHRQVPLHQEGVVRDVRGALVAVPTGATGPGGPAHLALTGPPEDRWLEVSLLAARAARDQVRSAGGWQPSPDHPHGAMARAALRDLHTLTGPEGTTPGAVLAGASPAWRFVWPRDASFVAAALARTGHEEDALEVLLHLQDLQAPDGSFQARYRPDGSGEVPDGRLPQEDGPGWALWAVRVLAEEAGEDPGGDPSVLLADLVTRSAARLLDRVDPRTGLPRPSPDYWERPEERLTLGVAATALMGLEAAAALAEDGRVPPEAWAAARVDPQALGPAAAELRARIVEAFGPHYPRHVGGRPDAAVTFLLPPFVEEPVAGAETARQRAQRQQARPAGGMAPGAGWRRDGISWTPQTALQALAARGAGRHEEADRWLDWLDRHRTATGALPEKVLHDGSPAAVAPLAWTAALVLLAVERR
ncbi:glycoside hydrolase family 15 [Ornithinimicrobium sp. W1679]|uniref:glycoside hydrolase family 15 n=1 Tax=Ornithinimicrobium sp. W1679 TaxID=3418770 RepID=UPI003CEB91F6